MNILQVNTHDSRGGAAKIARALFDAYRARGHDSWLVVRHKESLDPNVMTTPSQAQPGIVGKIEWAVARTHAQLVRKLGHEDFNFPGTGALLRALPVTPDIAHLHNLHGPYFDLRSLPWLSRQVPVVMTLHDAWLLSGNCAHSFNCERWKIGCGNCPDITIPPAIQRDATAYNWRRKRAIYAQSRLYVATPSLWLLEKVRQSILTPALADARVIYNGVDLSIFKPGDKYAARRRLGIPTDVYVLLFTANGIRTSLWKDYQTMRTAVGQVAQQLDSHKLWFIALGEEAPDERSGEALVRFMPHQADPNIVAQYYQAADIYLHAARVDTFPNTVLEALACGAPVIATAVGGIPEQIKPLYSDVEQQTCPNCQTASEEATGILTPMGNAEAMTAAIVKLLANQELRDHLGANAAQDARRRFDLNLFVENYLAWYEEIIRDWSQFYKNTDKMTG